MKKERRRLSIYKKLVFSYVVFSLLVIVIFVLCLLLTSFFASDGHIDTTNPYGIINQDTCEKKIPFIFNMDGWVEELDLEYKVKQVFGTKKTTVEDYQTEELIRLISGDPDSKEEFIGFLNTKKTGDGYYLAIYKRTDMQLRPTVYYSNENGNLRWYRLFIILFLVLFAGMCLLMGNYLGRRIKRPLKELTGAMKRVEDKEKDVRLDFKAEAEFAELRDSFNLMIQSLRKAEEEKRAAEIKQNRMLLELSHDIRTPISTISSFAVALEQDMVAQGEKKKYFQTIRRKAERVSLLTEDMFTMLKMKSSEYEMQKIKDDLGEFLRRQCAEYYADAQEKGLDMKIKIPEEPVFFFADYTLLGRVMGNFFSNALKYNKTGKEIAVSLKQLSQQILIEIADDGKPVPKELKESLFDDFIRGDQARKTDGGSGLGLSIAKAIIEKHGGEVFYEYRNNRNCFSIKL